MKTLVWPDAHHRTKWLKTVLANHGDKFDKRIFLGDWFDQFDDRPDHAKATAECLVELMEDPRNVFIEGNHDSAYRYHNEVSFCPGFSWDKQRFISSVMKWCHWEKFKLFEYEQGWLCSHAGVHPFIFEHPVLGYDLERMKKDCEKAVECAKSNIRHPIYSAGKSSGGKAPFGGITWLRWWEFEPIPGLNQIVGHTILSKPGVCYGRKKRVEYQGKIFESVKRVSVDWDQYQLATPRQDKLCSINYNIDTNNTYFAIIEDGVVSIQLTLDYL